VHLVHDELPLHGLVSKLLEGGQRCQLRCYSTFDVAAGMLNTLGASVSKIVDTSIACVANSPDDDRQISQPN